MLARLDHVIYSVPDIGESHRWLTSRFPEAWPVGRFWPEGQTSGVAIGGINLELLQIDPLPAHAPVGTTLAFQPTSFDEAVAAFAKVDLPALILNKQENDPFLLRLRGYFGAEAETSQWICRNLIPDSTDDLPFNFFVCEYSPFMKQQLSPANPRLDLRSRVTEISYGTTRPEEASKLLKDLGYNGEISIRFVGHDDRCILGIETTEGPLGWP